LLYIAFIISELLSRKDVEFSASIEMIM
jgi:hypothetical protein